MATPKLIILDDFHPDPDAIRRDALALPYPITGGFPGKNTTNVDADLWLKRLSGILNMPIQAKEGHRDIALFRQSEGGSKGRSDIHFDRTDWAGICYLTPKAGPRGGTAFFRHLETGLDHFPRPEERADLINRGIVDAEGAEDTWAFHRLFARDGWNRSKWEQISRIPYRYNRAAFYDASQFHTIDGLDEFGEDVGPRLVQVFFFDVTTKGSDTP